MRISYNTVLSLFCLYICLVIGVEVVSSIVTKIPMETSDCTLSPEHRNLPVNPQARNSPLASELGPKDGDSSGEGLIQLIML